MYQGTTPAVTFTIKGFDLSGMTVYVTFKSATDILTKSAPDVIVSYDSEEEESTVVCKLTQAETLGMNKGSVKAQIRFIDSSGNAYATSKAVIQMNDVLYRAVITYSGDEA